MKLVCLNVNCGRIGKEKLADFFVRHTDVDIFCLQEVFLGDNHLIGEEWGRGGIDFNLLGTISGALPEYASYFRPHYMGIYGLAIFAKKNLDIKEEGDLFIFKTKEDMFEDDNMVNHAKNIQYLTVQTPAGPRTVVNFHGIWDNISKNDTDDRLLQSDNIVRFMHGLSNPFVLCGDFNLVPGTVSLQKIEDAGMRNLIKEFGITSTRSSTYTKPIRFADYTFVSDGIQINEFTMLPDEVSDHLAMYLDFE